MACSRIAALAAASLALSAHTAFTQEAERPPAPEQLTGHRFLTFNTVVRVDQIEFTRSTKRGRDERAVHTPERAAAFREAVAAGFPGARMTWAFSWLALHDESENYRKLRELAAGYHRQYGDDVTFIPGGYFPNAYSTREQVNKDLHDALAKVSEFVGGGFRPKSVVAGFLAAENLRYLAEKEDIHVCQGNIFSQFSIDNQDGDGAPCYPYYPSAEHFCKPAQGAADFIDCVNLDGWSVDFLAARRAGFSGGFNSRMGVGPIETIGKFGAEKGLAEMMHTTAIHFDDGFAQNGFAWVPNCWELCLPYSTDGIKAWLAEVKRRWPDTRIITQGEFGLLWRDRFKDNSFDYRFTTRGSGIGGSDKDKELHWRMNQSFRLATLREFNTDRPAQVIDFTRYDLPAQEPQELTRRWSLMGEINQKQTRPQDAPVAVDALPDTYRLAIQKVYPNFFTETAPLPPQALSATGLQCEYQTDPVGIDAQQPRFSWRLADRPEARGQKQTAYRLVVATAPALLDAGQADVWDSGQVASAQSALVPFAGKALASGTAYHWRVQVFGKDGEASPWSATARFTTGLFRPEDWNGSAWIQATNVPAVKHVWLRRKLTLDAPAQSALIHVASMGYHELYVNGRKADDRILAPTVTHLPTRVLYVTYDIAPLLQKGDNVIAVWQGPGWAHYEFFRQPAALRVKLNGTTRAREAFSLGTDGGWRFAPSSSEDLTTIRKFGSHGGERVDGRAEQAGWNAVAFDDSAWGAAVPVEKLDPELCAHAVEPTRVIETLRPLAITANTNGSYRADMGRNFTGWLRLDMAGLTNGQQVVIYASDEERQVKKYNQHNAYIGRGAAQETFCNRFNYLAGRYLTFEGLSRPPQLSDVTGYAIGTGLKQTGHFTSSNALFNDIYETDLWTFRVNTTEGYTSDCPHRERLGYGEVATATAWGIGLPNYDSGAYYRKLVRDWSDVQATNGWVPHVAPNGSSTAWGGPMWSSAGLTAGWEHYLQFGDTRTLELIYPSAKRWLEFLRQNTKDGLLVSYTQNKGHFLGDWTAPGTRYEYSNSAEAACFNNCVYAMNLETAVKIAQALGHAEDIARYGGQLDALRSRIHETYYKPDSATYLDGRQVRQAFALLTGVTPENLRPAVAAKIAEDMRGAHPYFDMGSSGVPVLLRFVVEYPGFGPLVSETLAKTAEPGYGYFLARGETAWPEDWNSKVPSRIHTCYTGIASWFIKGLCGINPDPARPGYRQALIRPVLVPEVDFAEASVESPYGTIASRWERKDGRLELRVTVPPNSTARVFIPTPRPDAVTESGQSLRHARGVTLEAGEAGAAVVTVGSGVYQFVAP
ncbi:MAG: family 78 glycoside hydrolase catalytic domain [Verrucomicrobiota bacterium]|jgi:alpha-L-rhamnosidase|nr:family 78 glycoside hydrolase catalytic domain [Verrucomicrobiota bacterium]